MIVRHYLRISPVRKMKFDASILCFGLFPLIASPASAAGGISGESLAGPSSTLRLAMTLYAGGVTLGQVDMDAKFAAGKYHTVSNLKTSGVVNVFWQSEIQATSSGTLKEHLLQPELYNSFYTGHKAKHQEVSLTYENGFPVRLYANPPYSTRGFEVKSDEKNGTFDPLSAMIFITSGIGAAGNPCAVHAPVYDGRRRYDITMSKIKDLTVKMDNGLYSGPAIQCEIVYKQISGFSPRVLKDAHFPKIYAWVTSLSGKDGHSYVIPLRVWAKSPYGVVASVATEVEIDGHSEK